MTYVSDDVFCVDDRYIEMLRGQVRNVETGSEKLRDILFDLGKRAGESIIAKWYLTQEEIMTPMERKYKALKVKQEKTAVISTRDEYSNYADGLSSVMKNVIRGFMDFNGERGVNALTQGIRMTELPVVRYGEPIDSVIIAKSILATGCTAISLAKKAIEIYNPKQIIIASIFYTLQGICDVKDQIRNAKILVFGEEDELDGNGMLVPGVGNLDLRVNPQALSSGTPS